MDAQSKAHSNTTAGAMNQPAGQSGGPETWVDLYGDCLYRYALMRLRNDSAAEEIVQEMLLAALQSYGRFSGQ